MENKIRFILIQLLSANDEYGNLRHSHTTILWKENMNSDGQQSTNTNKLNNDLSHQTIERQDDPAMWHWKTGGPGLEQAQKCGRVKLVNELPTLPSW